MVMSHLSSLRSPRPAMDEKKLEDEAMGSGVNTFLRDWNRRSVPTFLGEPQFIYGSYMWRIYGEPIDNR